MLLTCIRGYNGCKKKHTNWNVALICQCIWSVIKWSWPSKNHNYMGMFYDFYQSIFDPDKTILICLNIYLLFSGMRFVKELSSRVNNLVSLKEWTLALKMLLYSIIHYYFFSVICTILLLTSLYKVENWKLAENWKIGKYLFQKFFCSTVSKILLKKFLGLLNGQSFMVIGGVWE